MRPVSSSRRVISLRLRRTALDTARRLARSRGTSVSRVIEDVLAAARDSAPTDRTALAERLLGSLRSGNGADPSADAREARIRYVEQKHR